MGWLQVSRKDEEIRRLAAECRAKMEFTEDGRMKIGKLARDLGLKVIRNESLEDSPELQLKDTENGKFHYDGKQGFVIYDETRTTEQKEFTLAHEIGHYMLRHWETRDTLNWIIECIEMLKFINTEREADLFAEYLLGRCSPYVLESVEVKK
ncbi:MAG: ImmA/IrrE family metallo-endopeptidase [Clostridia bacterium]|nr:ImmA/IrrE family metallo-endopeptidase [Clostridia bacterium]MBR2389039.1 ImmA/IrrE family metallo-endopeptidase [Clostridia bacterium]